jgi:Holliday junction resolvase
MIGIDRGARYQKIVGNFGEYLVCHWLSRSGFEVCIVDHTGMDVIAYQPSTKLRLGITVKSRTRVSVKESESVYIFREKTNDRKKLLNACEAFGCVPWIAVYVERDDGADLFITSLANYDRKYRSKEKRAVDAWTMTGIQKAKYAQDREVRHIGIEFKAKHWWAVKSNN